MGTPTGIAASNEGPTKFHSPENRHAQMLLFRPGAEKPAIIGKLHQKIGPQIHAFPDKLWKATFKADQGLNRKIPHTDKAGALAS
jgi:hypothetical protein